MEDEEILLIILCLLFPPLILVLVSLLILSYILDFILGDDGEETERYDDGNNELIER